VDPLPPPPGEIDAAAAALLKDAAARAGFDTRIFRTLGMLGAPGWKDRAGALLPRLPSPACGTLVRFFIIGDPVPRAELDAALGGPEVLPALQRASLAVEDGPDAWHCPLCLIPAPSVLPLSDPMDDPANQNPPDEYILPVGMATRYVDDLAVRDPCDLAVDLGCGQGYLALRALAHAQRAIATDINPRAIAFARANAALNGAAGRIHTRLGSFFEPLADSAGQVDLLTCNPPFIILPGEHVTALSTSMEGDAMLEHLVRTTPTMLREGGWATVIGLWEHDTLADWVSRLRPWLEGSGCDALALQFRSYLPNDYFQQWFPPDVQATAAPGFRALCQRRKIGAITYGGIVLHKRQGPNWLRALFTLINLRTGPASDHLRAFFKTQTTLHSFFRPEAVLERRLAPASGWRFDPQYTPQSPPPGSPAGLPLPLQNAANQEAFLAMFSPLATARQTLEQLHRARRLPTPPDHPATLANIHNLIATGALDILD
jgi:SAM-dependent methyltransferase